MPSRDDIYDSTFVRSLFDEMARTYGIVNLISSLGFAWRWRRQCVRSVRVKPNAVVLDLMTGMGELFPDLASSIGPNGQILAIDISPVMCEQARRQSTAKHSCQQTVIEANALACPLPNESVDYVFSTFGLKTFNQVQLRQLAAEVRRVLRTGGKFAFLEISVPQSRLLRFIYLAYINHVIPLIGKIALGNPENYRMLGIYTEEFGDCRQAADCFAQTQLQVSFHSYFFGCATGFSGTKEG